MAKILQRAVDWPEVDPLLMGSTRPNGIKRAEMVVVESAIWKGAVRGALNNAKRTEA